MAGRVQLSEVSYELGCIKDSVGVNEIGRKDGLLGVVKGDLDDVNVLQAAWDHHVTHRQVLNMQKATAVLAAG